MLNILTEHSLDGWIIHIIPRKLHRPSQFFAPHDDQLMISPAAVILEVLFIVPRKKILTGSVKSVIEDILRQVCFEESELTGLINEIL